MFAIILSSLTAVTHRFCEPHLLQRLFLRRAFAESALGRLRDACSSMTNITHFKQDHGRTSKPDWHSVFDHAHYIDEDTIMSLK